MKIKKQLIVACIGAVLGTSMSLAEENQDLKVERIVVLTDMRLLC